MQRLLNAPAACSRFNAFPARHVSLSAGLKVTQKNLRQALPAFAEDYQLQEALARCEIILSAGDAEQTPGTMRFVECLCLLLFQLSRSKHHVVTIFCVSISNLWHAWHSPRLLIVEAAT